ncbi:MAG: metallophosphoesterase [Methylobacterium radiotolerans]
MPQIDVSWLHLTDLHVGMTEQKWLWPTVKHALFDDIARIRENVPDIDLVIFSGDLVQRGIQDEFDRLDQILSELWEKFISLGCNPALFHVPGNHDIARPAARDPDFLNISRWWDDPAIQIEFWKNEFGYFEKLKGLFSSYTAWSDKQIAGSGVPTIGGTKGILPGDQAAILVKDGCRIGLIGLNSTWLQFSAGDLRGKLSLELRQLQEITNGDPRSWCDANHSNILVTHQPVSWLHPNVTPVWESEINPPGRFDAHLYGHMHDPEASSVSTFGSSHKVSIQGPSLFGLEYLADGKTNRAHGYSLFRLQETDGHRSLRMWPRTLNRSGSGTYRIIPDYRFELERESILLFDRQVATPRLVAPSAAAVVTAEDEPTEKAATVAETAIGVLKYHLAHDPAHDTVRKLDQHRVKQALARDRMCWIVSEWGMGADEFISSLLDKEDRSNTPTFKLSIPDFADREQLSSSLKELYGFSVERLIDQLAELGRCILIFDDVDAGKLPPPGELNTEERLEHLCKIALEYCQELKILLRSRSAPVRAKSTSVQLREFDAVDLRGYVIAKKGEFSELCLLGSLQTLLRHTDGVPVRLDSALEELEVVPLSELINSNSDLVSEALASAPSDETATLVRVLKDLKESANHVSQRSYELLKVLSIFPRGEQLSRIARFRGSHAFYPQNATELLKLSLIESTTTHLVGLGRSGETSKVLLAPRLIRERVRDMLSDEEYQSMNRRAAELYFGSEWESGNFRPPPAYRFDNPHCGSSEIQNANAIAIRALKDARDFGGERETGAALSLATSYTRALIRGDHFWSAAVFLDDYFSIVPEHGFDQRRNALKALHAQALRMIGDLERSRDILVDLDLADFDNNGKQSALVDLLLCYQVLRDEDQAKAVGERILSIDRQNPFAWQARSVLLEMQPPSPERTRKLRILGNFCRKNDANRVADEIALTLARESKEDVAAKIKILESVISNTSTKKGFYTRLRASMQLAEISFKEKGRLDHGDQSGMIIAYHYLFNENLSILFNKCHDLLWEDFEIKGDIQNLSKLFRHSSLSWRLQGRDDTEMKYLKKAQRFISGNASIAKIAGTRELAYYESRAAALLS